MIYTYVCVERGQDIKIEINASNQSDVIQFLQCIIILLLQFSCIFVCKINKIIMYVRTYVRTCVRTDKMVIRTINTEF